MSIGFIAFGSNIGDRKTNIEKSLRMLEEKNIKILSTSSFYITEPYGYTDQPEFLNGVAKIKTEFTPRELLYILLDIEFKLGRERKIRWGPRTIDLDILFYDGLIVNEKDLVIPHPDLHNRRFVLDPLNEIAPEFIHPVFGKNIRELYCKLNNIQ